MTCTVPLSRLGAALARAFIRGFVGLFPGRTCQTSSLQQSVQTNLPALLGESYQNHSGEEKACLALRCFFELCCLICASALTVLQWSLSEWFCLECDASSEPRHFTEQNPFWQSCQPKASEVSGWLIKRGEHLPASAVSALERDIKCNFIYWKAFENGFK